MFEIEDDTFCWLKAFGDTLPRPCLEEMGEAYGLTHTNDRSKYRNKAALRQFILDQWLMYFQYDTDFEQKYVARYGLQHWAEFAHLL